MEPWESCPEIVTRIKNFVVALFLTIITAGAVLFSEKARQSLVFGTLTGAAAVASITQDNNDGGVPNGGGQQGTSTNKHGEAKIVSVYGSDTKAEEVLQAVQSEAQSNSAGGAAAVASSANGKQVIVSKRQEQVPVTPKEQQTRLSKLLELNQPPEIESKGCDTSLIIPFTSDGINKLTGYSSLFKFIVSLEEPKKSIPTKFQTCDKRYDLGTKRYEFEFFSRFKNRLGIYIKQIRNELSKRESIVFGSVAYNNYNIKPVCMFKINMTFSNDFTSIERALLFKLNSEQWEDGDVQVMYAFFNALDKLFQDSGFKTPQ